MRKLGLSVGLVALMGFGACSEGGTTAKAPGKKIELAVAPLTLAGIGDACYDIRVTNGPNGTGDVVWSQGDVSPSATAAPTLAQAQAEGALCAGTFGNGPGGDIAYVGPCDASDDGFLAGTGGATAGTDGTRTHTVTLWVENLYQAGANAGDEFDPGEWDNPFPPGSAGGSLAFECAENKDVSVVFNLVILRDANQGFFDVAVNFADVFCSAKLDTCTGDDQPIKLLFDRNGDRAATAVLALACTGGPGSNVDTVLHMSSISIDCGTNGTVSIDPTVGPGNAWKFGGTPDDPAPSDFLYQYSVYEGNEQLNCGGGSCNKRYWNIGLGINAAVLPAECTVKGFATASDGDFPGANNGEIPTDAIYPVIKIKVPLRVKNGVLGCTQNGLNDGGGLTTGYTDMGGDHCPVELCYLENATGTVYDHSFQNYSGEGIPGVTWAPQHYLNYAEAVGYENAISVEAFCGLGISKCCVENWAKYAEAIGTTAPPTPKFCANAPCVENYLKYSEGLGGTNTVSFDEFVAGGLCTGTCVENYLKLAEATGNTGNPSILEIASTGDCTQSCIENYLKYAEAVGIGGNGTESFLTWSATNCGP